MHLGFPLNIQGTSSITGSGGVVVAGATTGRTLAITNTVANPFSGGLYINGDATVTFNTADTQLGATSGLAADGIYVRGGTLSYTSAASISLSTSGNNRQIVLGIPGANVDATGTPTFGNISVGTTGTALTIPGLISGPGMLVKAGSGTLTLSNSSANTYAGGTSLTAGTLSVGADNQLGPVPATATNNIWINGSTLQANSTFTLSPNRTIVLGPITGNTTTATIAIDVTGANTFTIPGILANNGYGAAGPLTKTNTGTLVLTGADTYSGSTTVNNGSLVFSGSGTALNTTTATVNAAAGITSSLILDSSAGNVSTGATFPQNRINASVTLNASAGGSTELKILGNSANTSVTLPTLAASGGQATNTVTLVTSAGHTILDLTNLVISGSGTSLLVRGDNLGGTSGAFSRVRIFNLNGTPFTSGSLVGGVIPGVTVSNTSAGSSLGGALYDFTTDGNGIIGVKAPPLFSGAIIDNFTPVPTIVPGGNVVIPTNANFTSDSGSSTLTVNGQALIASLTIQSPTTNINNTYGSPTLTLGSGGLTSQTQANTINGVAGSQILFGGAAAILTTTDLTISSNVGVGPLTGVAGLTKTGAGTLTLNGANNLIGNYSVNAGNLTLGQSATVNSLTTVAGTTVTTNGLLNVAGATSTTVAGVIAGAGGLANTGTALLTLQGVNTYAGPTIIQSALPLSSGTGPTLTLSGAAGALTATSSITIGKNATLQLTNATGSDNPNRVPDTASVAVNGGQIGFTPIAGSSETFGNLNLTGTTLLLNNTAAGISTVNFGTVTRSDRATAVVGSSIGTIQSSTVAINVFFAGGVTPIAVGSGTGTETGVIPWMISASGGTTTNTRSFVTYDSTNGLQVMPYSNASYFLQIANTAGFTAAAVTNQNVHLSGAGTVDLGGGTVVVNSLTTNTSTITFTNGTLQVFSGGIVNWDSVVWSAGATLDFGANTGYIHSSWQQVFQGTSQVTGSNGLVVAGLGTTTSNLTTFENTNGNPFTGGLTVNGNTILGFRQDNQLGAANGAVTLGGGMLSYDAAANLTVSRNIRVNEANGGVTFNIVSGNATAGNATSTTNLTLSGVISGPGAFIKDGIGIATLTNTSNSYSGGTVVNAGILSVPADAVLGAVPASPADNLFLNGGTFQPSASMTLAGNRRVVLGAIDGAGTGTFDVGSGINLTVAGSVRSNGPTGAGALTKTSAGALTLTSVSPYAGATTVSAGTMTLSGSGAATGTSGVAVAAGATFKIDNTAGPAGLVNRLNDAAAVTLTGGTFNLIGHSGGTSEVVGALTIGSGSTNVVNLDNLTNATTAATNLTFASLTISGGSILFSGTGLGGTSANSTHLFFTTAPALVSGGIIANAFFSSVSGGANTNVPASYDVARGVVQFTPTPVSGNYIDNIATTATPTPTNSLPVPVTAAFTVSGSYSGVPNNSAKAVTGASLYSLTLDGANLTLYGGNSASSGNGQAANGTLNLGGTLTSQNGAKTIFADAAAPTPTINFGPTLGTVTTTSDLTISAGIALAGTGGITKQGAGALIFAGNYGNTGPLTANTGAVNFTGGAAAVLTGPLTVASGTSVNFGTSNSLIGDLAGAGTLALAASANLTVTQVGTTTFSGTLTGGNIFTKAGTGALTFAPAVQPTYAGGTVIAAGTLKLGSANALPAGGALQLGSGTTGGTLDLNGTSGSLAGLTFGGSATTNAIINSNAATQSSLSVDVPTDVSVPVAIGGNINATKTGAGNLTLAGTAQPAAAGTGLININAGTLTLTTGTPVSPGMNFNVATGATLNFGTFGANNTDANAFGTITSTGGAVLVTGGSGDLADNKLVLTGGSVDFTGTSLFWWHFRVAGAGITTNASDTTVTFTGPTSGSRFQNDTGANLPITVAAGTTASGIDLDAGITFSSGGTNTTFEKLGPGTMRITNTANTANFVVTAGALQVDDVNSGTNGFGALGTGSLTLNGGTLAYGTAGDTNMSKPIALGANGGTIAVFAAGTTLGTTAAITGPGSLTVAGPGNFALLGTSYTYSANTVITAGTLFVVGSATIPNSPTFIVGTTPGSTAVFDVSATGGFTLGANQKIQGSGTVVGNITLSSGSTIAPGNSIGTLALSNGTLTFQPGANLQFEHNVNAPTAAPTTAADHINGSSGGFLDLTQLDNFSNATRFNVQLIPIFNGAPAASPVTYTAGTFQGINLGVPTTPFGTVNLANGMTGATDISSLFNFSGQFASTPIGAISGNVLYFQFTPSPVPEPAFVLLACGGVAGGLGWYRRRRALNSATGQTSAA